MKPENSYEDSKENTAFLKDDGTIKIINREAFDLNDVLNLVKKRKKRRKNN